MDGRKIYYLIFVLFLIRYGDAGLTVMMTRQQLKNSGKLMKNTCMKRIDVAEEMIVDIDKGKFIEDRKVMCYIACVFELTTILKNNKIVLETAIKQIDMMYPPELKETAKAAAVNCKDVQKNYKDVCEIAYWSAKCIYDFKPEDFVFA